MIMQLGARLRIKATAAQRLFMCHFLSRPLSLFIVTEYPKSGGSWVSQMLAAYLGIPFPRNQPPPLRSCVMHGHYLYSPRLHNVLCVVRDGRDVMVSAYYHLLFKSDKIIQAGTGYAVDQRRRQVNFTDYDDIRSNLPAFIHWLFRGDPAGFLSTGWSEFNRPWLKSRAPVVRYEDLLQDASQTLGTALEQITGEAPDMSRLHEIETEYSFENLSGRKRGQENTKSFLRKGIAGDWKSKFNREARQVFDHYAGDTLIECGYEVDHSWVEADGG